MENSNLLAHKAQLLLSLFPRAAGGKRVRRGAYQLITRVTGGRITGQYLYVMAQGRITTPGSDKLQAMAEGLQFDPRWWFDEDAGDRLPQSPILRQLAKENNVSVQWWSAPPQELAQDLSGEARAVATRLSTLPPGRKEKVLQQIYQLLQETGEEDQ